MNVKLINISPEFENILGFLYPDYQILSSGFASKKFITHYDVTSLVEKDSLNLRYSDAIIISTKIFDEVWDLTKIKEEVLLYQHKVFRSRKKSISTDDPNEMLMSCFFEEIEEDSKIIELFDTIGSRQFIQKFLEFSKTTPAPVLESAVLTFLNKVMMDTSSVYYKKKFMTLGPKIKANFVTAYDSYKLRVPDQHGLSFIKFINDIFS